jgi:hypothetical protein
MIKRLLLAAFVLGMGFLLVWASDRITLQGERTIYTANCADGAWDGLRCSGHLAPGKRYRFVASKSRQEVLHWVAGSAEPSGKYGDCSVKDRGNWFCNARVGEPASITYEMQQDRATRGAAGMTIPFYAVPKWKWWLMDVGARWFTEASY